jgi:hypothetical protein
VDVKHFPAKTPLRANQKNWQGVAWRSRKTVLFDLGTELWRAGHLYSGILKEISTKGKESRFQKTDRGRFARS